MFSSFCVWFWDNNLKTVHSKRATIGYMKRVYLTRCAYFTPHWVSCDSQQQLKQMSSMDLSCWWCKYETQFVELSVTASCGSSQHCQLLQGLQWTFRIRDTAYEVDQV